MKRPVHAWSAAVALAALAVAAGGCGLFRPADPEASKGGTDVPIASYAEPESCLHYMAVGIARKDNAGQTLYTGALADSVGGDPVGFHAYFDPAVWNAYVGIKPADWDYEHEEQFYGSFITIFPDPYELVWLQDEYNPHDETPGPDDRILHRHYKVRVVRASVGDTLVIGIGYADLSFRRISAGRWALTRWQDRVDPEVGAQPLDSKQQTMGGRRLNSGSGG